MAARRSLGGGRILGSGRTLSPVAPVVVSKQLQYARNTGLLSPSESSVSLSSQTSSTPLSTEHEDISSRVAADDPGPSAATSASSRMVCPICNEEMVTLLQLNRHIDDNHANLEEVEQDEVKTWFKQQMDKAKKFQPLAVINQKLKGLDVFESNDAAPPANHNVPQTSQNEHRGSSPAPAPPIEKPPDAEEVVTRVHWQRATGRDSCCDPMCGKRLGGTNGQIHCRHCGKLFCDEHTLYQMKLSRSAQHEPIRGMWCRVCETCYKTREGYNDHSGLERNHFDYFKAVRRKMVDKQYLEVSRLEKRLTRLTQLLADPPPDPNQATLWPITGNKNYMRTLEQSVVTWEEDALVLECPFCQQAFSQYTFRRHHCRICGRVVCGDPQTGCSTEIGLNVNTITDTLSEKAAGQIAVDVRMCKECQHTIFSRADFDSELAFQPPDQRSYENLVQFEHGIRLLLPRFQRLLFTLQDPDRSPTSVQLADAAKVRRRLTDAFTKYDFAARRIRDLPTESATQAKLQKAIYVQATNFLHIHMLPLKSLPKILKHATPDGLRGTSQAIANGKPQSALASIRFNDSERPSSSRTSSVSSAAVTALEAEEKELRERLIVLEEQKFMVGEMIADANKRRKFDEVASLAGNIEDLSREIDQINGQLAGMDFAGAYAQDGGVL